jgi:hypothetical protein
VRERKKRYCVRSGREVRRGEGEKVSVRDQVR